MMMFLAAVAALFALVTGANDGGTLLATGLKLYSLRVATALAALVLAVAFVPMLLGTQVATTFSARLAAYRGQEGQLAAVIAVLAAIAVVAALNRAGRPTSLTLAIVGGLTGAGLGYGLRVSTGTVGFVLGVGLAAPVVVGLVAYLVSRIFSWVRRGTLAPVHRAGFALQCLAYAVNDGQKMLGVFVIVLGVGVAGQGGETVPAPLGLSLLIGLLFGIGTLYGLPGAGRTLGEQLLVVRPVHAVSAELAAAGTVLGCGMIGVPISMTQAVAGGLIGAGVMHGYGRIRWHAAWTIALAWLLTLPASLLLAFAGAALVRGVIG